MHGAYFHNTVHNKSISDITSTRAWPVVEMRTIIEKFCFRTLNFSFS